MATRSYLFRLCRLNLSFRHSINFFFFKSHLRLVSLYFFLGKAEYKITSRKLRPTIKRQTKLALSIQGAYKSLKFKYLKNPRFHNIQMFIIYICFRHVEQIGAKKIRKILVGEDLNWAHLISYCLQYSEYMFKRLFKIKLPKRAYHQIVKNLNHDN